MIPASPPGARDRLAQDTAPPGSWSRWPRRCRRSLRPHRAAQHQRARQCWPAIGITVAYAGKRAPLQRPVQFCIDRTHDRLQRIQHGEYRGSAHATLVQQTRQVLARFRERRVGGEEAYAGRVFRYQLADALTQNGTDEDVRIDDDRASGHRRPRPQARSFTSPSHGRESFACPMHQPCAPP